jgi:hypothetical protein
MNHLIPRGLRLLLLGLTTLPLCAACDNLLEYHPYEGRIDGKTDILSRNIPAIEEACRGRKQLRIAFISDTQRWYDDTHDCVDHINARGDIDFVLHGGDMTDFGATDEFEWMRDELERLQMPYASVIGNHDCVGHGEHIYEKMFGAKNYGFTAGSVRIECLNTVALEYDYSDPVPDFTFMKREREVVDSINAAVPDSITHTIFVMHSRPGDEQFNNNVADAFNYYITQYPGMADDAPQFTPETLGSTMGSTLGTDTIVGTKRLSFCLCGHNHRYEVLNIFDNGILYYGCANVAKREYFVFTINETGYDFERVFF